MYAPVPTLSDAQTFDVFTALIRFCLLTGLSIIFLVVYRLYFHPLAKIPEPFLARCSTLWQNYHYIRGTWHDNIRILHEEYGPAVRISHYEVSFVHGAALKRVYGHVNPCKKVIDPTSN
jgi:hypothetical protein